MTQEKKSTEQQAHDLLAEEKYQDAAELYLQAAKGFQRQEKHDRAAICLAASASSRALILGERTFHRVASLYEEAAQEAETAKDLEYASMLYKYAAIAYERDNDNNALSECFFKSREAYRRFLIQDLFHIERAKGNTWIGLNFRQIGKRIVPLITATIASLLWGHGERPQRIILFGLGLILIFALFYMHGHLSKDNIAIKPSFIQAAYFSFTAYTKVGTENMSPIGFNKVIALIETFIGIFTIPLYLTGLCRKYLRY
ncbi:MAG: two pore domain potassium channel family protein [Candidatus Omnitrophica bacterium]|nr:two pore domain potassium channel family protein [Candidatus Omnitrophota bacterium]